MTITTLPHKVQPSRYALHLLRIWIRRNAWWAFGIPVTASLILSMLVDLKYIYIAVIMVCLVLPHVFVSVYWRHLLSNRTCRWLMPHTVTIDEKGLTTDYVNDSDNDENQSLRPSFTLDLCSVTACRITDGEMLINIDNDSYHIVIIPLDAFPDSQSITAAYRLLM